MKNIVILSILVITLWGAASPAFAQDAPVVQIVFFNNPHCENCHQVTNEVLPPLQEKYGAQLEILQIDTAKPEGSKFYQTMSRHFQLPDDRLGTPAIVIHTTVLVGADEIQAKLPELIAAALAGGGTGWPDIPGLQQFIDRSIFREAYPAPQVYPQPIDGISTDEPADPSTWERFSVNFKKDPVANSLAVISLVVMAVSMVAAIAILIRGILVEQAVPVRFQFSHWFIPALVVLGLGVAGYLTFVEVGEKPAVCGPIGHCNEVQNSSYAKLFGILPIGLFGLFGYTALLAAWGVHKFGPKIFNLMSSLALWGMSLFGVAFSIYLTFLEPFVIGATCMWCLSSAWVMTALLWVTTPLLQDALARDDEAD